MPSIKLQSSDGKIFEIDVEIAKQSIIIKTILDIWELMREEITPNCSMVHPPQDDPPPPEDDKSKEKQSDDIPIWDQKFLKVDQGTFFKLVLTAANMIKGKTPEEIHKTFSIKNDFTEKEEAQGSLFSASSPTFVVSCLVNFPHSHWCEVVSHCGFDLYFPDGK
ncbi:unnamed protein product [Nyctereutes procyonoides]|uniref:S-phase kinase-associated protein 1 n=1 Tax=Nyctereutes procyonoides TaxID=34880 RepID=A0A811ZTP0_NYCPR|nr:unnamed protein product [Nyctereutes procyonoides]